MNASTLPAGNPERVKASPAISAFLFLSVFSAVNAKITAYPRNVEVVFAGISTTSAVDPVTMIVVMRTPSTITISMVVYPMRWSATRVPG